MVRRTKEEMLAEYHRLFDIFDVVADFMVEEREREREPEAATQIRESIPAREDWLRRLSLGGVSLSQILSGLRQALNDWNEQLAHSLQDGTSHAHEFLANYLARTGRHYFDDVPGQRKAARIILKRGVIRSGEEFRLISGVVSDKAQTVFAPDEFDRAGDMLAAFERSANASQD